jgi:hypothetical protein
VEPEGLNSYLYQFPHLFLLKSNSVIGGNENTLEVVSCVCSQDVCVCVCIYIYVYICIYISLDIFQVQRG